jgi:hypothetical protein
VASAWFAGELDGVLLVAFVGDAGCPPYELQRAVVADPQDRALGQDIHSLSVEGATTYGAVASWRLEHQRLQLDLTDAAVSKLGVPQVLQAAVDVDAAARLRQVLPRILASAPTT